MLLWWKIPSRFSHCEKCSQIWPSYSLCHFALNTWVFSKKQKGCVISSSDNHEILNASGPKSFSSAKRRCSCLMGRLSAHHIQSNLSTSALLTHPCENHLTWRISASASGVPPQTGGEISLMCKVNT